MAEISIGPSETIDWRALDNTSARFRPVYRNSLSIDPRGLALGR